MESFWISKIEHFGLTVDEVFADIIRAILWFSSFSQYCCSSLVTILLRASLQATDARTRAVISWRLTKSVPEDGFEDHSISLPLPEEIAS